MKVNNTVEIAWGNGKLGLNGTPCDESTGSRRWEWFWVAVIVIDEQASDIKNLPTIIDNPDVLLFHELCTPQYSTRNLGR